MNPNLKLYFTIQGRLAKEIGTLIWLLIKGALAIAYIVFMISILVWGFLDLTHIVQTHITFEGIFWAGVYSLQAGFYVMCLFFVGVAIYFVIKKT